MNFLKRRFSDLGPNLLDTLEKQAQEVVSNVQGAGQQQQGGVPQQGGPGIANHTVPPAGAAGLPSNQQGGFLQNQFNRHQIPQQPPTTLPRNTKPGNQSAPSSPPAERRMERQQSGSSGVGGFFSSLTQKAAQTVQETAKGVMPKMKILLVIDDLSTDWSKYFRGRKLFGDFDIRVEQAEFHEISVKSHSDGGTTVEMHISRGGPKVVRTFKPDFVLLRQQPKTPTEDYSNLLVGFQFGGVPSVNSWQAAYNFQNKPWNFAQLIALQKKLGKEKFPLIEQVFYPTSKQMGEKLPRLPVVVKLGHGHGGSGKVKVDTPQQFDDLTGVVGVANTYATSEPFVDSKFDFRIQKIGPTYKVYMRTSNSGGWKSNVGSSLVEQVNMNDTFRMWMDRVSEMYGGMDICAISALRGKDNKDYIIEVNDCCMPLIGDKQDEDRRAIADLVMRKMESACRVGPSPSGSVTQESKPAAGFFSSVMSSQQDSGGPASNQMQNDMRKHSLDQKQQPPPPPPPPSNQSQNAVPPPVARPMPPQQSASPAVPSPPAARAANNPPPPAPHSTPQTQQKFGQQLPPTPNQPQMSEEKSKMQQEQMKPSVPSPQNAPNKPPPNQPPKSPPEPMRAPPAPRGPPSGVPSGPPPRQHSTGPTGMPQSQNMPPQGMPPNVGGGGPIRPLQSSGPPMHNNPGGPMPPRPQMPPMRPQGPPGGGSAMGPPPPGMRNGPPPPQPQGPMPGAPAVPGGGAGTGMPEDDASIKKLRNAFSSFFD